MRGPHRRRRALLIVFPLAGLLIGQLNQASGATQPAAGARPVNAATTTLGCFSSGAGATYFQVCVSNEGNVLSIQAPSGNSIKGSTLEGYELCDVAGLHGYDAGSGGTSGFGSATITEPGGANTLPLTISRKTNDGEYRLTQTFALDGVERDFTITMAVKNLTSSSVAGVRLVRYFVSAIDGDSGDDVYDDSTDSVWGRDVAGIGTSGHGLSLSVLSLKTTHNTYVSTSSNVGSNVNTCGVSSVSGPTAPGDFGGVVLNDIGSIAAGASKTVKLVYRVF